MLDTILFYNMIYFPFPCSYIKTKKILHICRGKTGLNKILGSGDEEWTDQMR